MVATANWITGLLAILTFYIGFVEAKTVEVNIDTNYEFFPDVVQAKKNDTLTFAWKHVPSTSSDNTYVALADPDTISSTCIVPKADTERIIPQCGSRADNLCNYNYDLILDNSILDDTGSAVYITMWINVYNCAVSTLHIYTNGTTNGHGYSGSTNDNSGSSGGIDATDDYDDDDDDDGIGGTNDGKASTNSNAFGKSTSGVGSNVTKIVVSLSVTVTFAIAAIVWWLRKRQTMPPQTQPAAQAEIPMVSQAHWTNAQLFVSNPPAYSMEGTTMSMPTSPNRSETYSNHHNTGNPALHYKP